MTCEFTFVSLAVVVALSMPLRASAEDPSPQLQVRTAEGQTLYHIGERIPLELSFTGPENKRFEINMASYDRSGRMGYEEFNVGPAAGWADPLHVYFGSSSGFIGGGLTGFGSLSAKPTVIKLNLNEWVRFDRAGTYTVVVVSHRVSDISTGSGSRFGVPSLSLTSNPIQLCIIPPTRAWQRAKLSSIVKELEENPKPTGIEPDSERGHCRPALFRHSSGSSIDGAASTGRRARSYVRMCPRAGRTAGQVAPCCDCSHESPDRRPWVPSFLLVSQHDVSASN